MKESPAKLFEKRRRYFTFLIIRMKMQASATITIAVGNTSPYEPVATTMAEVTIGPTI